MESAALRLPRLESTRKRSCVWPSMKPSNSVRVGVIIDSVMEKERAVVECRK